MQKKAFSESVLIGIWLRVATLHDGETSVSPKLQVCLRHSQVCLSPSVVFHTCSCSCGAAHCDDTRNFPIHKTHTHHQLHLLAPGSAGEGGCETPLTSCLCECPQGCESGRIVAVITALSLPATWAVNVALAVWQQNCTCSYNPINLLCSVNYQHRLQCRLTHTDASCGGKLNYYKFRDQGDVDWK